MIINEVDNELKDIAGWIDHGKDKDLQMIYYGFYFGRSQPVIEVYSMKESNHKIAVFREKIVKPMNKKALDIIGI